MQWSAVVSGAGLYPLGLVAVQSHLLRYGIGEISPLDVFYVVAGVLALCSLRPGADAQVARMLGGAKVPVTFAV